VVPIRALYQHIRQNSRDQFPWRFFIKKHHRIHSVKAGGQRCPRLLVEKGTRRAFQFLNAPVRIQSEDQAIAERSGTLEKAHMAGMQNVITAVREYNAFSGRFPLLSLRNEGFSCVQLTHSLLVYDSSEAWNDMNVRLASILDS
jgi:hypothetical protein